MSLVEQLPARAPAKSSRVPGDYIPTLDGWRAIAILAVIVCHGSGQLFSAAGRLPNPQWLRLTDYGALGVDVFFGISGFLICTRILQEEHRLGRISLRSFYIRRAFRILPPYLLYLAAAALLTAAGILTVQRWEFTSCLLFVRNYMTLSDPRVWYTGHFWSLAIEEHFYLFLPTLLFLFRPRRNRRVIVVLAIAVAFWRAVEFRHGFISRLLPGSGFYPRTDIRVDALLWGCWLALLFDVPAWRAGFARWMSRWVWVGLMLAYFGCVVLTPPFAMMWQAMLIPLLLIGTVLNPLWLLGRLLETVVFRWIGRISYGLYLWQQMFLVPAELPRPLGFVQLFPFNVAAVFVVAATSYYFFEKHMMRWGRQLASRPPSPRVEVVPVLPVPLPQENPSIPV